MDTTFDCDAWWDSHVRAIQTKRDRGEIDNAEFQREIDRLVEHYDNLVEDHDVVSTGCGFRYPVSEGAAAGPR